MIEAHKAASLLNLPIVIYGHVSPLSAVLCELIFVV